MSSIERRAALKPVSLHTRSGRAQARSSPGSFLRPSGHVELHRVELSQEARFSAIETFGMKRIFEPKSLIIQMVADLVQQRAQECLEFHHLYPPGGPHPQRNFVPSALVGFIEPVKLARLP